MKRWIHQTRRAMASNSTMPDPQTALRTGVEKGKGVMSEWRNLDSAFLLAGVGLTWYVWRRDDMLDGEVHGLRGYTKERVGQLESEIKKLQFKSDDKSKSSQPVHQ
ncbi:hypothetical protein BASA81_007385 [Batrachochytrium salamandrivorans]|nr:hypothetical protein BASA81_018095 [Batrachochytrium salamandrivorans]KAH9254628.1 hypothetical protein BASA81_007385 [Batrachochytrium salamandrivorans]